MPGKPIDVRTEPGAPDAPAAPSPRRAWVPPRIEQLPRLTELTLDSILGGGDTSGGTVF